MKRWKLYGLDGTRRTLLALVHDESRLPEAQEAFGKGYEALDWVEEEWPEDGQGLAVVTTVADDFCTACQPGFFADRPEGPLHWSTRFEAMGRAALRFLEPIQTDQGPLTKVVEVKMRSSGSVRVLAASLFEGKTRPCPCGSGQLAHRYLHLPWARVSFAGPRVPGAYTSADDPHGP